jgi:putative oxidoreductase
MGSVGEKEQMNQTPNVQRPTLNTELSVDGTTSTIKHRRSNVLWRVVDFIVAVVFLVAGLTKIFDLDRVLADLWHLRLSDLLIDLQHLRLASPQDFAHDINNFRILPWILSVGLAFYLPWLEIFCGLALVGRFLYRGALSILTALIVVFTLATAAAKLRGLDITCGCFGHASQHWSFPAHLATNLAILAGLLALSFKAVSGNRPQSAV